MTVTRRCPPESTSRLGTGSTVKSLDNPHQLCKLALVGCQRTWLTSPGPVNVLIQTGRLQLTMVDYWAAFGLATLMSLLRKGRCVAALCSCACCVACLRRCPVVFLHDYAVGRLVHRRALVCWCSALLLWYVATIQPAPWRTHCRLLGCSRKHQNTKDRPLRFLIAPVFSGSYQNSLCLIFQLFSILSHEAAPQITTNNAWCCGKH